MAKKKTEQERDKRLRGIEVIERNGEIVSYKFRCCVGRNEEYKQIWRTATISKDDPRIDGLTPAKLLNALSSIKHEWDIEQKEAYEKDHAKTDKRKEKQRVTLDKFIRENWLQLHVKPSKLKPSTKAFYGYMADDITAYFGDRIRLNEVDREAIEKYEIYLRNEAKKKDQKKKGEQSAESKPKPLSDTSVRRHLETLRNILRYAKVNKYIADDPFADYSIENKSDEAETVDYLTPAEIVSFYDHLESESKFWQLYIRLSLLCGLRRGEMVALQWGDIDTDKRKILVQRNVTVDTNSEAGYNIGSTKTKKKRVVFYTETIDRLLSEYKAEQTEKYKKEDRPTLPDEAFVFCTPTDPLKPVYPTTPTTWLKRFEQKNGLREVSPHDLRHTTGTLAKMAGYSNKDIQTELGHSDSKTTDKFYVGIDERALQSIPEDIESVINQAKQ